ncbi:hypothetical protein DFH11DRAFT_1731304 [Phellopilus nigrolimitatus]|nr:hypothetical protein DFH11DRAFT_1731304 [Phellopilus nigrolimitatus]
MDGRPLLMTNAEPLQSRNTANSSDGSHAIWIRRSASSHSTVKLSFALAALVGTTLIRPSPSPPTLDRLASAAHPKPGLLGGAGSVGLETPRAYLPERVTGALGAVPQTVGATNADAVNVCSASKISPALRAWLPAPAVHRQAHHLSVASTAAHAPFSSFPTTSGRSNTDDANVSATAAATVTATTASTLPSTERAVPAADGGPSSTPPCTLAHKNWTSSKKGDDSWRGCRSTPIQTSWLSFRISNGSCNRVEDILIRIRAKPVQVMHGHAVLAQKLNATFTVFDGRRVCLCPAAGT